MKLNTDKCRLIVSGYEHEQVSVNIRKNLVWESNDIKLLGVTIDRDLKFDKHVLKLCSKANQKLSALSKMANLFSVNKTRTFFKAFVESQFKYCPIVRIFHGRRTNNKINRLHEPLELFMMPTSQLFINYLHGQIFLYSPSKYPETLN